METGNDFDGARHRSKVDDPGQVVSCEAFAAMLNLSGKRRFHSQRIVLYAVLASMKYPGAMLLGLEALESFRSAHVLLMTRSDSLPGVFCAELREAYFGDEVADMRIRSFIDLAEGTLIATGAGSPEASDLLVELINSATPILDVLDRITSIYQELATQHARSLREEIARLMTELRASATEAGMTVDHARIAATGIAGAGEELSRMVEQFGSITTKIDSLTQQVLVRSAG